MRNVNLRLDYFSPTEIIGFWILFIGILFTTVMFYFVFFRLTDDDYSYKDRERKKLEKERQMQIIARLYPKKTN